MIGKKGQGTTEYLIILSVIIVIALVVVGVMGWFPGLGTTITEQQSKAFWAASSPVAITSWDVNTVGNRFFIRNQTTDRISVTDITLDGTSISTTTITPIALTAGSTGSVVGETNVKCPSAGELYSYNVAIFYDVSGGLTGVTQTGTKPIIGTCGA